MNSNLASLNIFASDNKQYRELLKRKLLAHFLIRAPRTWKNHTCSQLLGKELEIDGPWKKLFSIYFHYLNLFAAIAASLQLIVSLFRKTTKNHQNDICFLWQKSKTQRKYSASHLSLFKSLTFYVLLEQNATRINLLIFALASTRDKVTSL